MERLTRNGVCRMKGTKFCVSQRDCCACLLGRKCFQRLSAYEDTGLNAEALKQKYLESAGLAIQDGESGDGP